MIVLHTLVQRQAKLPSRLRGIDYNNACGYPATNAGGWRSALTLAKISRWLVIVGSNFAPNAEDIST